MKKLLAWVWRLILIMAILIGLQNAYLAGIIGSIDFSGISEKVENMASSESVSSISVLTGGEETESQDIGEPLVSSYTPAVLWYRSQLDAEMQEKYDILAAAIAARQEKITMKVTDEELQMLISCVTADRPDLFWFDGGGEYTAYLSGRMVYTPEYTYTEDEIYSLQSQIDAVTADIFSGITSDMDDYQKALHIYEYLVQYTTYNVDQPNQNFVSVMLNHEGVCQGYTEAYQYLLNMQGIQATSLYGTADGESHSWNIVNLDGNWYQVDVTWGDPTNENTMTYTYCFITDEQMYRDHQPEYVVTMPECTAVDDNYFIRNDLQMYGWDFDTYEYIFEREYNSGDSMITVRFDTDEAYQQACSELFDQGSYEYLIRNYLDTNTISVRREELHREITFIV